MLSIIVAFDKNYVIGKDNKLLWRIPNDLKRFKEITNGKSIIMGRKTFESLPCVLPNRCHIILTNNYNFTIDDIKSSKNLKEDDEIIITHYIKNIIALKEMKKEYFIIGGGEIYKELLPYCDKLYITQIDAEFLGDTYFPTINYEDYKSIEEETCNENGLEYKFITLEKK